MARKTTTKPAPVVNTDTVVHDIHVHVDGTVTWGNGDPMTWEEAHKYITQGRKHNQDIRRAAAAEKRAGRADEIAARKAKKAERLAAQEKKLAAKLAGIKAAQEALAEAAA